MIKKNNKNLSKREKIKNYVLLSSVFLVPLLFFLWAGYISISSVGANINVILDLTNEEITKIISMLNNTWYVFKIMAFKKKYKVLLLVFNVIALIVCIIDFILNCVQNGMFYNYDILIFAISSLIGLYYAYKLFKEML